jgi:hypothetical protein
LPETALPLLLGEALMSNNNSLRGKAGMFPRCLVVCTLILLGSMAGAAQSLPDVFRFDRNIVLAPDQRFHNAGCFLCSADVEGQGTGSVRVVAGNVFLNGSVAGNVLVFGGNVTLTSSASIGGRVLIFGGHLHRESAAIEHPPTVFSPIIFLPVILVIGAIIGGLIVLTRRMVRGPVAFPPLPRL